MNIRRRLGLYIFISMAFSASLQPSLLKAGQIHEAAEKGDLETVKRLIREQPSLIDAVSEDLQRTPLHYAIRGGQDHVALYLIDQGADIGKRTERGRSPLLFACMYERKAVVIHLLAHDVDLKSDREDSGFTPLSYAGNSGNTEIAGILLEHGADINAQGRTGHTAATLALAAGKPEMARFLIEHGADPNHHYRSGRPILHMAIKQNYEGVAHALIAKGASVNARDGEGYSTLFAAVETGNEKLFSMIVEAGGDLNAVHQESGMNLAHRAAIRGHLPILAMLSARDINLDAEDKLGRTPAYYAARYGHRDIFNLLMDKGIRDVAGQNKFGYTELLNKKLESKEAVIWYLGHSGWAVKTRTKLLIFDYWNSGVPPREPLLVNGRINIGEIEGCDVTAFSSHEHGDHYDPVLWTWVDKLPNIKLIFGWKLSDDPRCVYLDHNREPKKIGDLIVEKVDSGNVLTTAFYVEVDGLRILHGGDQGGNKNLGKESDISYLAQKYGNVDILFTGYNFKDFSEHAALMLKPKVVFPMHSEGGESQYPPFAEGLKKVYPDAQYICAENRGDHYIYSQGRIDKD